jgi:hypothetical protein
MSPLWIVASPAPCTLGLLQQNCRLQPDSSRARIARGLDPGLKSRAEGNCSEEFSVIFTFPSEVIVTFASKQYAIGYSDIGCRMYGAKGKAIWIQVALSQTIPI